MHARGGHAGGAGLQPTLNILQLDAILRSALHDLDDASIEAVCLCAAQACDAAGQCNLRAFMLSLPEHGEAGLRAATLLGRMIVQGGDDAGGRGAAPPQPPAPGTATGADAAAAASLPTSQPTASPSPPRKSPSPSPPASPAPQLSHRHARLGAEAVRQQLLAAAYARHGLGLLPLFRRSALRAALARTARMTAATSGADAATEVQDAAASAELQPMTAPELQQQVESLLPRAITRAQLRLIVTAAVAESADGTTSFSEFCAFLKYGTSAGQPAGSGDLGGGSGGTVAGGGTWRNSSAYARAARAQAKARTAQQSPFAHAELAAKTQAESELVGRGAPKRAGQGKSASPMRPRLIQTSAADYAVSSPMAAATAWGRKSSKKVATTSKSKLYRSATDGRKSAGGTSPGRNVTAWPRGSPRSYGSPKAGRGRVMSPNSRKQRQPLLAKKGSPLDEPLSPNYGTFAGTSADSNNDSSAEATVDAEPSAANIERAMSDLGTSGAMLTAATKGLGSMFDRLKPAAPGSSNAGGEGSWGAAVGEASALAGPASIYRPTASAPAVPIIGPSPAQIKELKSLMLKPPKAVCSVVRMAHALFALPGRKNRDGRFKNGARLRGGGANDAAFRFFRAETAEVVLAACNETTNYLTATDAQILQQPRQSKLLRRLLGWVRQDSNQVDLVATCSSAAGALCAWLHGIARRAVAAAPALLHGSTAADSACARPKPKAVARMQKDSEREQMRVAIDAISRNPAVLDALRGASSGGQSDGADASLQTLLRSKNITALLKAAVMKERTQMKQTARATALQQKKARGKTVRSSQRPRLVVPSAKARSKAKSVLSRTSNSAPLGSSSLKAASLSMPQVHELRPESRSIDAHVGDFIVFHEEAVDKTGVAEVEAEANDDIEANGLGNGGDTSPLSKKGRERSGSGLGPLGASWVINFDDGSIPNIHGASAAVAPLVRLRTTDSKSSRAAAAVISMVMEGGDGIAAAASASAAASPRSAAVLPRTHVWECVRAGKATVYFDFCSEDTFDKSCAYRCTLAVKGPRTVAQSITDDARDASELLLDTQATQSEGKGKQASGDAAQKKATTKKKRKKKQKKRPEATVASSPALRKPRPAWNNPRASPKTTPKKQQNVRSTPHSSPGLCRKTSPAQNRPSWNNSPSYSKRSRFSVQGGIHHPHSIPGVGAASLLDLENMTLLHGRQRQQAARAKGSTPPQTRSPTQQTPSPAHGGPPHSAHQSRRLATSTIYSPDAAGTRRRRDNGPPGSAPAAVGRNATWHGSTGADEYGTRRDMLDAHSGLLFQEFLAAADAAEAESVASKASAGLSEAQSGAAAAAEARASAASAAAVANAARHNAHSLIMSSSVTAEAEAEAEADAGNSDSSASDRGPTGPPSPSQKAAARARKTHQARALFSSALSGASTGAAASSPVTRRSSIEIMRQTGRVAYSPNVANPPVRGGPSPDAPEPLKRKADTAGLPNGADNDDVGELGDRQTDSYSQDIEGGLDEQDESYEDVVEIRAGSSGIGDALNVDDSGALEIDAEMLAGEERAAEVGTGSEDVEDDEYSDDDFDDSDAAGVDPGDDDYQDQVGEGKDSGASPAASDKDDDDGASYDDDFDDDDGDGDDDKDADGKFAGGLARPDRPRRQQLAGRHVRFSNRVEVTTRLYTEPDQLTTLFYSEDDIGRFHDEAEMEEEEEYEAQRAATTVQLPQ